MTGQRSRFVGRVAEMAAFRAALATSTALPAVLYVHGPGGIGKSALLDVFADIAVEGGASAVRLDLAALPHPSAEAVLVALATQIRDDAGALTVAARQQTPVVLLDGVDAAGPLDRWLREWFVPALPERAVLVIAARRPPNERWRADPAWRALVRVLPLRALAVADARSYLVARAVPHRLRDRVLALAHGHPLALSLLAGRVRRGRGEGLSLRSLADVPDVAGALLAQVLDAVPSSRHRAALQVCAHARHTTEDLLRAALGGAPDAAQLFDWLRTTSMVEEHAYGLVLHGPVRDALDAELRARDRVGYAEVHRRVRAHLVEQIRRTTDAQEHQHRLADVLFLARSHPAAGPVTAVPADGERVDAVRPADHPTILEMTTAAQGPEQAALVRHWLARRPQDFRAFRGADDVLLGYAGELTLSAATAEELAADPGARAMWDYALRHGRPWAGERVTALRFLLDRDAGQCPSVSMALCSMWRFGEILSRPAGAWDLVGAFEHPEQWVPLMRHADYGRAAAADFEVGGRRYAVFAHDWRQVGVEEWLDVTASRELGDPVGPPTDHAPGVLSEAEFAAGVQHALRDLHRPEDLAANALLRSRLVRSRAAGMSSVPALAELVRDAVEGLRGRGELHDVLDVAFLRPLGTQGRAAEQLHLSFSTYRRRRNRAVAEVVEVLWRAEQAEAVGADRC